MMLQTWYREMETHYPQNDENNSFILSIIDNSPIAYLLVNNQFDIVYSNKMALSLFGYDDLKGVPINNLIPMYARKAHRKKMAAYQKKPEFRKMGWGRELKGVRQDGTEVEVEIGLNPVTIIPERYILASIIDITERKKIEKFKDHFLMMMTHELRTPLNAILGYSEIIKEELVDENPVNLEDLDRINESAKHLLEVVDNLMESSRSYTKQIKSDLETFDIPKLVNLLKTIIEPSMNSDTKLIIKIDKSLSTQYGDYLNIKQCLINLLSNAVKFTDRGTITLSVYPITNQGEKFMNYTVSDTGIGIAPEHHNKIFDKFYQVDISPNRKYGGTGLGLFVCKQFSEQMGGNILIESNLGKGSTFKLILPEVPKVSHLSNTNSLELGR
jgi:PAS domain S-box-containing protein